MADYTVVYGTLDQLPADGPGIYNRAPDPSCEHPLGMQWVVRVSEYANSWSGKGPLPAPDAVICLCCGCDTLNLRRTGRGKSQSAHDAKTRDECEKLMHAEFLRHWYERDMSPATVANTLYYLFGKRAFPTPGNYFRGRSCPDRRLAKLHGQPRGTPVALRTAREARALGVIKEFPRDVRRLATGQFVRTDDGGYFAGRRAAWMTVA